MIASRSLWSKSHPISSVPTSTFQKLASMGEIIASLSHFPDFYTKQALKVWRSPLHAVFYWNVKGKSRKNRKDTARFLASLGAGVQPRSTVQRFMPVSGVEKPPFSQFFLGFGQGRRKVFCIGTAKWKGGPAVLPRKILKFKVAKTPKF